MIFILSQLIICKQVFDFTIRPCSNLLLYINKTDIIEIVLNKGIGAYFSSWDNFDDLIIEFYDNYPINDEDPLQSYESSSGFIGVFYNKAKYALRIFNDGDEIYKLFILFSSDIPKIEKDANKVPEGFSLPVFKYVKDNLVTAADQLYSPFLFNSDSRNDNTKTLTSLTLVFIAICLGSFGIVYYYTLS